MDIRWKELDTPEELRGKLRELSVEYPLQEVDGGENCRFISVGSPNELSVTEESGVFVVRYGAVNLGLRGLAYVLAGKECHEVLDFSTFGILFDCTRGNIMTVEYFKHWLRRLALFGFNLAMIYTKDAYQLPDEPYFGFMRGAYSLSEMQEIDRYAKSLGIEMIASIQALGHLEPILRWPAYGKISDTSSAILVDEPESYKLLEKIFDFWDKAFSSRRIHLGMDETHDLGRGRFMDIHGYENPFGIYNRHLQRVCEMCGKRGFKPIIWSDMYFRYANKDQNYYDLASVVPEEVKKAIPEMVQMSYWDYYHRDPDFYAKMLAKTGALNGSTPFMASGVWTWATLWCDYEQTKATVGACLQGCRKVGVREIVFTMWGDDGGYCEFDSAFAGLAWTADAAANGGQADESRIAALYGAVCGADYRLQLAAGNLEFTYSDKDGAVKKIRSATLLWDDPLMGIVRHEVEAIGSDKMAQVIDGWKKTRDALACHKDDQAAGRISHAWQICDTLIRKAELREAMVAAYRAGDKKTLAGIVHDEIPAMIQSLDAFLASFRSQWLRSFKPYGLELMEIRIGGLKERYRETATRLMLYCTGASEGIEEFDANHRAIGYIDPRYLKAATGSFFI